MYIGQVQYTAPTAMQTTVPAPVKAICDRYDLTVEEILDCLDCDLEDLVDDDEGDILHLLEANGMDDIFPWV